MQFETWLRQTLLGLRNLHDLAVALQMQGAFAAAAEAERERADMVILLQLIRNLEEEERINGR
jgi:hypothetical protein